MVFQVFGSESSQDLDCMVFVDHLGSTKQCHDLCTIYGASIRAISNTDKEVNTNLAIIKDDVVVDCFKGTYEEVNNSLYITYDLHKQYYSRKIKRLVDRDIELKILRTIRVILSFLSRSQHRVVVKNALRSDIYTKIKALNNIDLSSIDMGNKKVDPYDYCKVIAFQLGQTLSLIDGDELYTKESIGEYYPDLSPLLMRDTLDFGILEAYKVRLLNKLFDFNFKNVNE